MVIQIYSIRYTLSYIYRFVEAKRTRKRKNWFFFLHSTICTPAGLEFSNILPLTQWMYTLKNMSGNCRTQDDVYLQVFCSVFLQQWLKKETENCWHSPCGFPNTVHCIHSNRQRDNFYCSKILKKKPHLIIQLMYNEISVITFFYVETHYSRSYDGLNVMSIKYSNFLQKFKWKWQRNSN